MRPPEVPVGERQARNRQQIENLKKPLSNLESTAWSKLKVIQRGTHDQSQFSLAHHPVDKEFCHSAVDQHCQDGQKELDSLLPQGHDMTNGHSWAPMPQKMEADVWDSVGCHPPSQLEDYLRIGQDDKYGTYRWGKHPLTSFPRDEDDQNLRRDKDVLSTPYSQRKVPGGEVWKRPGHPLGMNDGLDYARLTGVIVRSAEITRASGYKKCPDMKLFMAPEVVDLIEQEWTAYGLKKTRPPYTNAIDWNDYRSLILVRDAIAQMDAYDPDVRIETCISLMETDPVTCRLETYVQRGRAQDPSASELLLSLEWLDKVTTRHSQSEWNDVHNGWLLSSCSRWREARYGVALMKLLTNDNPRRVLQGRLSKMTTIERVFMRVYEPFKRTRHPTLRVFLTLVRAAIFAEMERKVLTKLVVNFDWENAQLKTSAPTSSVERAAPKLKQTVQGGTNGPSTSHASRSPTCAPATKPSRQKSSDSESDSNSSSSSSSSQSSSGSSSSTNSSSCSSSSSSSSSSGSSSSSTSSDPPPKTTTRTSELKSDPRTREPRRSPSSEAMAEPTAYAVTLPDQPTVIRMSSKVGQTPRAASRQDYKLRVTISNTSSSTATARHQAPGYPGQQLARGGGSNDPHRNQVRTEPTRTSEREVAELSEGEVHDSEPRGPSNSEVRALMLEASIKYGYTNQTSISPTFCDFLPGMPESFSNSFCAYCLRRNHTRSFCTRFYQRLHKEHDPLIHTVTDTEVGPWDVRGVHRRNYPLRTLLRPEVQLTDRVQVTRDAQASSSDFGPRSEVSKRPRPCLVITRNSSPTEEPSKFLKSERGHRGNR